MDATLPNIANCRLPIVDFEFQFGLWYLTQV